MIGQKKNLETIMKWRCNKSTPHFIIISGELGSGRLTLSKVIMKMLNAQGIICGCGIDDVRKVIDYAYTISAPTMYIFRDADDMSVNAKNALLKVVEEPPRNVYFIMTVKNLDNMLSTIRSRATVINMEHYSKEELQSVREDELLLEYCSNIGQLQVDKSQVKRVEECVDDVIKAFSEKSGTKLLKTCTQLRSKQTEEDKIDCLLFFRVFQKRLYNAYDSSLIQIINVDYLLKCKKELSRNTVNKKASIECMLVKMLDDLKNEVG